jgi:hypothetical protein
MKRLATRREYKRRRCRAATGPSVSGVRPICRVSKPRLPPSEKLAQTKPPKQQSGILSPETNGTRGSPASIRADNSMNKSEQADQARRVPRAQFGAQSLLAYQR